MHRSEDDIRPGYRFDVTCQRSMPEALICTLEAVSFDDALRNAISIGGDSDTITAIAGPVAEARFGIPQDIATLAWTRVLADMRAVIERLYHEAQARHPDANWPSQSNQGPHR